MTVGDRRLAVIDAGAWEALIEWLEPLEDIQIAGEACARLKESAGDRTRAGWLRWSEIRDEMEQLVARILPPEEGDR